MAARFRLPLADVGNGISPSDGAKLEFFNSGLSTQKQTFSDEALLVPNANPVIANGDGVFPAIWLPSGDRYKVILSNKIDVQISENDPVIGDTVALSVGVDIASSATITVGQGDYFSISGTTNISAINTVRVGKRVRLHFNDALTLIHSANFILIPDSIVTSDDIVTIAGDVATFIERSVGQWECTSYKRADGTSLKSNASSALIINWTMEPNQASPTAAVDVTDCDQMIVRQNGDDNQVGKIPSRPLRLTNVILDNINIGNSGLGGLDTGVLQANMDYYLWCVAEADGTFSYVWSLSVQFPNNTAFPTFIYAHRCGWNASNGVGSLHSLRKTNFEYHYTNDGNSIPIVAAGSNGGVFAAVSLLPFVSPEAQRIRVLLKSVDNTTTVGLATNTTNTIPFVSIQQRSGASTQMTISSQTMIESAFIFYSSTDTNGEVRIAGFEDIR